MLTKKIKSIFTPWNFILFLVLLLAFILRIYRINDLLDFHYDQGRDAMVVWNLVNNGKLFLIGPVTGLEGIFLGPFYYYLITPFYLIGQGNPVYASIFLSILVTTSILFVYKIGYLVGGKKLGLISMTIASFSSFFIFSSRWLSNPTPMYLTSVLIFYCILKIINNSLKDKNKYYWYLLFLLTGISMHFESASAAFYIPILFCFTIWQFRKINWKTLVISGFLFFLTFVPQIIFDLKHDNILSKNILSELSKQDKSNLTFFAHFYNRLIIFWNMFSSKLFTNNSTLAASFSLISLSGIILGLKHKKYKDTYKAFLMFLGIPFVCYIIYRGNHGVLYDYYFTGYYLVLIILFSFGLWVVSNLRFGNILLLFFFILFLSNNMNYVKNKLSVDIYQSNEIFISNQIKSIEWIYNNAGTSQFNVDIYVPPVIPHSYNYLFTYLGDRRSENLTKRLYTLYEVDPSHPDRLEVWLDRQKGIGKVVEEVKFGGIIVQRRERIKYEK